MEIDILSIDHVDGNGAEHRMELFGNRRVGGYRFYLWLKRNDYPDNFQVLCFSCQFRKRSVEMKPENPTPLQITRAKYAQSVRLECLDNYGERQCSCGEKDLEVLTLDHINDDGAEHRQETGTRGYGFYIMLRKSGFSHDVPLQVLCINCQIRKRNRIYEERKNRSSDDGDGATVSLQSI